ncbi:hypothetical protein JTB14_007825 [Gonioctena quinquepunctata]|nr:hypothetical protein JTB14_007825 [Gonioctena quinquepunctata]
MCRLTKQVSACFEPEFLSCAIDQQKKHRKVLRAAFTKSANELDKLLSEEVALQQVQVVWEVLLQKHENLLIANTLLRENVSEEDLMLEIDCCEGYEKKFIDSRITYGNRQKHVDIGLDEDDRRSRASLAVSKSTLGPVPGAQSENNGGANPELSTMSRLESLMSFVKSEVENEERISLAAEGFGLNSGKSRHEKSNKPVLNESSIPTATVEVFRKNSFLQSNMLPENLYNSQIFEVKRSHGFQRVCRAPPREKDSITTSSRRIRLVPVRVFNSCDGS